jgi:hypothetical protein
MNEQRMRDELSNPNVGRQMLHQMNISNGRYNKRVLSAGDTSPDGEYYGWIMFVTETTFTAITDESILPETDQATALTALTFAAGSHLAGYFTDITVNAGDIICFTNKFITE